MSIFTVDKAKCHRDGICSKVCPARIIDVDAEGVPSVSSSAEGRCIACGHCMAFCPHAACVIAGLPLEECRPIERKLMPEAASAALLLQSRRSIRHFSGPAPRPLVEQILAVARFAPTAKNTRNVRWVIVDSAHKVRELAAFLARGMEEYAAQEPLDNDKRAAKALVGMWNKGVDPFLRGAPQLAVAVAPQTDWTKSDCAIALTYFELAAHSLGVGCAWAGYFTSGAARSQSLRDFLGLQGHEAVGGGQMFGLPALRPRAIAPRLPLPVQWV